MDLDDLLLTIDALKTHIQEVADKVVDVVTDSEVLDSDGRCIGTTYGERFLADTTRLKLAEKELSSKFSLLQAALMDIMRQRLMLQGLMYD